MWATTARTFHLMLLRSIAWTAIVAITIAVHPSTAVAATPTLIDQRHHSFTLESLHGAPVILSFISAHCVDVCPLIDAQMAQAAAALHAQHIPAYFVSLTLDPKRDSFDDMRHLAETFHADATYWKVASGQPREVEALMNRFGVKTARGADGYADAHTSFIYMLDRRGSLVKTMLPSPNLATQLEDEVHRSWLSPTN